MVDDDCSMGLVSLGDGVGNPDDDLPHTSSKRGRRKSWPELLDNQPLARPG